MSMKPITEYVDYRKVILDFYNEKKQASVFSWREFAKSSGFSSAIFLKYVCEGKKNLSISAAASVASAMSLAGFDAAYFNAMVVYASAKTDDDKMKAYEEMCALAKKRKVRTLGANEYVFFKSWKNSLIRELAPAMPGAKPFEMAKVCKPLISANDVGDTLAFLENEGFLKKDDKDVYHQTDKTISIGCVDVIPVAARNLQRQMGELALDAVSLSPSERSMSGITMGITRNGYERIVKALAEFRKQILNIVSEDGDTEQVYRLNLQFFPLTENVRGER